MNAQNFSQLTGLWTAPGATFQINADGTAIVDGQMFQCQVDAQSFLLIGSNGSVRFTYRLAGDTLTVSGNGQTFQAKRMLPDQVAALRQAVQRGAGVWVGNESSLDPSLYISWTQFLVFYPDGTVDYTNSESGAQVGALSAQFVYSQGAGPTQQRAGRWQAGGQNNAVLIQWNNGYVWQGQMDVVNGKMMIFGIGRLNEGANIMFERQPIPWILQPAAGETPQAPGQQRGPQPGPSRQSEPAPGNDAVAGLYAALQELQKTGQFDPALNDQLMALANDPQQLMQLMNDPERYEAFMKQAEESGAFEIGDGEALQIEDYYREGPGKYTLRWPVDPSVPLPVPFDQLDRKTQFFVLFSEWTRREMQATAMLNAGQVDQAEQVYKECLERAGQVDVDELKARSYEGLMRVAQKRGDRQAEREWIQAAQKARNG